MKDKNRARLREMLNADAGHADIVNLVEDIVRDECADARKEGREDGFTTGWDSALTSYMD